MTVGASGVCGDAPATIAELRKLMNAVIGNRTYKATVAREGRLARIVPLLLAPLDGDVAAGNVATGIEMRILSANIVGSLAHGASAATLLALLRADVPLVLVRSLADVVAMNDSSDKALSQQPAHLVAQSVRPEQTRLLEASLRALRSVMCAVSDQIGASSRWGIGSGWGSACLSGLEYADSRNSNADASRRTARSLRLEQGWDAAGPPMAEVRAAIGSQLGPELAGDLWRLTSSTAASQPAPASAALDEAAALDALDAPAALNWLARASVALLFHPAHLRLLLGPLYLMRIQRKGGGFVHVLGPGGSAVARGPGDSTTPEPMLEKSLALETRARLLGICELVCTIQASCVNIAGLTRGARRDEAPLPFEGVLLTGADPEQEVRDRCQEIISFGPTQSPFYSADIAPPFKESESVYASIALNAYMAQNDVPSTDVEDDTMRSVLLLLLQLAECNSAKVQEAALWALTEVVAGKPECIERLTTTRMPSNATATAVLLGMRHCRVPAVRLAAFSCLVHVLKHQRVSQQASECVMRGLLDLLECKGAVQVQASFALARLVSDAPDMQHLAVRLHACERLADMLRETSRAVAEQEEAMSLDVAPRPTAASGRTELSRDECTVRLHEGCLTMLAALTFQSDDIRRHVLDTNSNLLSSVVVPALTSQALGVQVAACRLVRALSRTIGILRTSLFDAGVAQQLVPLLDQEDPTGLVRTEALATICNLLVKFSPMKKFLVEHGGVQRIAQLAHSQQGAVRLNALWAIKNALWESESPFKREVLDALGGPYLAQLAQSGDLAIVEQALNIVRNLSSTQLPGALRADIDLALEAVGADALLLAIEDVVWGDQRGGALVQAAYVLVNIASGSDEHRLLIINRPNLLDALCFFLQHENDEVREAGVRCGFNLTYRAHEEHGEAQNGLDVSQMAVDRLRAFGYDKLLGDLRYDPSLNVRDHVHDTLLQF